MEKQRRIKMLSLSAVIVAVLGLTVAFAALSTTLNIKGSAYLDAAKWGIKFQNLSEPSIVGEASDAKTAKIEKDVSINDIKVALSKPGDSVTYTVDLVNDGDINAKIENIEKTNLTEEQQKYITFTVKYKENDTELKIGDILSKGQVKPLVIKIEYRKDLESSDLPKSAQGINLSYKLDFVQTDEEDEKLDFMDRVVSTGENFAYLRIAEGCDNRCTFCAIPYIRGKYISRKFEDVIEEAKMLAKSGIKELIVIAQDTTKYGVDIYGKARLAELLNELCKIDGIKWIRFLYAYPETITDELINVVKNNDKICNYFDIPIQHISDKVLKRMNRKSDGKSIRNVVAKIRKEIPNVIIRTTVMVGFPGETNEDFDELYEFIKEAKFDRLGAFSYSKEEGTPAARIKEQVHPMTKTSRYNKIMALQQKVYEEISQKYIGKELEVLLEERSFDGKYYIARSYMDVPDIDGVIFVNCDEENLEGQFAKVKILKTQDYDLIAEKI